ncbi:MAG TPA: hypothetical protein ENH29_00385 [Bacteroidetes bacterium]|nr:hypothetical protein [Bacteroidota bacterium]
MDKLIISIIIGGIAGVIDVIPMLLQKLDKYANISAFIHWIVLGIIISYVQMPLAPWLQGLVIAELSALPIVTIVAKEDTKSIIPILVMSAILGILVGISTAKFA